MNDIINDSFSNQANEPSIEDFKNIVIWNTNPKEGGELLKRFETSFPTPYLIHPTPFGATFFKTPNVNMESEAEAIKSIHNSLKLDACIMFGNGTDGRLKHIIKRIEETKKSLIICLYLLLVHARIKL